MPTAIQPQKRGHTDAGHAERRKPDTERPRIVRPVYMKRPEEINPWTAVGRGCRRGLEGREWGANSHEDGSPFGVMPMFWGQTREVSHGIADALNCC